MTLENSWNDLQGDIRSSSVELLNRQLIDALDLGLQAKQAHWNVKGPQFLSLHELFDSVAESMQAYSDLLAERAVQLGGNAGGTAQEIARETRLPLYGPEISGGLDHVRALLAAVATFAASARTAVDRATKSGDANTADILTEISRGVDAIQWKLAAHTVAS